VGDEGKEERERESFKQEKKKIWTIPNFNQPMCIKTAVYAMHKRLVALKMSFKHRQETREYIDT